MILFAFIADNKKDYLSKYIVRKYLTKTITNIILLHFEDNLLVILLRKCHISEKMMLILWLSKLSTFPKLQCIL